jgi:hypothetical protein
MKSLSSVGSAPGLAFTGAPGSLGAWIVGSIGGAAAIGSAPNTEARIAARACSAAVAGLGVVAAAGDGIEADVLAADGI